MSRQHHGGSAPSQRMLRVAELFRHSVAELLARGALNDPALDRAVITISIVKMSPDLKLATIFLMPPVAGSADEILAALNRNKKQMRTELAHRINLKFAPDLVFRLDTSLEKSMRLDSVLNSPQVQRDLKSASDSAGG